MRHTVRFSEVDAAGIVFFSRVFEWCHHAFEDATARVGLPIDGVSDRPWLLPLVHAEADYVAPMRLGDAVHVAAEVERVGSSSVTWRFTIADDDGAVKATVRHVHACVDPDTFGSRPVPDTVRDALEVQGKDRSDPRMSGP